MAQNTAAKGGYDYMYVESPPDRLVCIICQLPCRETQMNESCGHAFCKSDIEQMKTATSVGYACPVCRAPFTTFANKQIDREVQQLKIYCPNKSDGCGWIGELAHVEQHLHKCEITCSKCQQPIHHTEMSKHNSVECPCYCQYCDTTAGMEVISTQHKEKCHKCPLPCPNQCGQDSIPRCDMDEHKNVCPLEVVQCPYCGVEVARNDEEVHNQANKLEHFQLQFDKQVATLKRSMAKANEDINTKLDTLMTLERSITKANEDINTKVDTLTTLERSMAKTKKGIDTKIDTLMTLERSITKTNKGINTKVDTLATLERSMAKANEDINTKVDILTTLERSITKANEGINAKVDTLTTLERSMAKANEGINTKVDILTTLERSITKTNGDINTTVNTLVDQETKKKVHQSFNVTVLSILTIVIFIAMLVYAQAAVVKIEEMKQTIMSLQAHVITVHDKMNTMTTQDLFSSEINKIIALLEAQAAVVEIEEMKQTIILLQVHVITLHDKMNTMTTQDLFSSEINKIIALLEAKPIQHDLVKNKMKNYTKQQAEELTQAKLLISKLEHKNKQLTEELKLIAQKLEGKVSLSASTTEYQEECPTPISSNSYWSHSWHDDVMRYLVWPIIIGSVMKGLFVVLDWSDNDNKPIVRLGVLITLFVIPYFYVGNLLGGVLSGILTFMSCLAGETFAIKFGKDTKYWVYTGVVVGCIVPKLLLVDVLCMPWSYYWWLM